jgi:hypothetical protein
MSLRSVRTCAACVDVSVMAASYGGLSRRIAECCMHCCLNWMCVGSSWSKSQSLVSRFDAIVKTQIHQVDASSAVRTLDAHLKAAKRDCRRSPVWWPQGTTMGQLLVTYAALLNADAANIHYDGKALFSSISVAIHCARNLATSEGVPFTQDL